jgi:surface antigen
MFIKSNIKYQKNLILCDVGWNVIFEKIKIISIILMILVTIIGGSMYYYSYDQDLFNDIIDKYYSESNFKACLYTKNQNSHKFIDNPIIGEKIDSYKNVPVYYNGKDYAEIYGKNIDKSGYYYGYKWQCVEYVKRFYCIVKKHKMPNPYGNAKDYFDVNLKNGEYNTNRGLYQFRNESTSKPEIDDLIVFTKTKYGHVAIVTLVTNTYIEIIQQNAGMSSRAKFDLVNKNSIYTVGDSNKPVGWLRK